MPWTSSDAHKHMKGLSKPQADRWADVANGVLASCMKGGKGQADCEGEAIATADKLCLHGAAMAAKAAKGR